MSDVTMFATTDGSTMAIDAETGFLCPAEGYKLAGFTPEKKLRFIDLAAEFWPNVTALCAAVGIHRQTYSNHYKLDDKFRELVDEAREKALDEAEAAMRANSVTRGGFMDRIALLKAYRPERWNPEARLTVTHDIQLTQRLAAEARKAIPTTGTVVNRGESE